MPRIPLYNQGQGPLVELAKGSLSRQASVGAFTAPGQALASFGEKASDIAFQFGLAEQKREDARVSREEYAKAFDELSTHVLEDNSTNVEDAANAFKQKSDSILSKIDSAGYSKRRSEIIKSDLSKLLLQKGFDAKQQAHKRGLMQSGMAFDGQVLKAYETLRSNMPGTPQWEFTTDLLRASAADAAANGIPTTNTLNAIEGEILSIERNNTRLAYSNKISSATSKDQLDDIEKTLSDANLTAPTIDVLKSQIQGREVELSNEKLAKIINTVDISNVGDTQFDTVEEIESQVIAIRTGQVEDEEVKKLLTTLTDEERIALEKGLDARLQQARSNYSFKESVRDKARDKRNDDLYVQGKNLIMGNDANAISALRELEFEGARGEALREQLIDFAGRRARGEIITDSKPGIYRETQQMIWNNTIQSVEQKFVLSTDSAEVKASGGKSIIERQGNELSDGDAAGFHEYLSRRSRQDETDENQAFIRNMQSFNKFVDAYKDKIVGNPAFAKLNINSDSRFYDFTKQMEERFLSAIESGKNPNDLLNPRHPDFIISPNENWTPSDAQLLQEITETLRTNNQIPTAQEVGPPPRPEGMSFADYQNTPEYQEWKTGPNYTLWLNLQNAGGQ